MADNTRLKLIESIEHKTSRKVAIDTAEKDYVLAKCHSQHQSPLYSLLPREMRDLIWAFATTPVEDKAHPYKNTEFYYRPGHTARLKTDFNISLTCRRAWLEAHALPMLQAEHSFWYDRAAPDARSREWMASLTRLNRKHFGKLHLYVQMYRIEGLQAHANSLRNYFLPEPSGPAEDFQPSTFHVTIRHTDWWHWEDEAPLRFEYGWFQAMLNSPDLRRTETLMLELETLDYKVAQLNPIVRHIRSLTSAQLETHIVNEQPTNTKFVLISEPDVTSWSGPTEIDGKNYPQYANKTELKYHVVTLTWQLHFPQYPNAHISKLRVAPRFSTGQYALHLTAHKVDSISWQERNELASDSNRRLELNIPEAAPRVRYNKRRIWRSYLHDLKTSGKDIANPEWEEPSLDEVVMKHISSQVWDTSAWQARVGEFYRRRQFWQLVKTQQQKYWREMFAKDKSLLRLEHDIEFIGPSQ